jgi:hypothetical protein
MNGYHWVTDSNYDWGQDLLRLQTFVNQHPEIDRIAVDYFGGGSPEYYLSTPDAAGKEVDWNSSKGNPAAPSNPAAYPGQIHWLAVSVNTLEGAIQPLGPGQTRNPQDEYSWLTAIRPPQPSASAGATADKGMGNVPTPDYRVGTSIFVYHL